MSFLHRTAHSLKTGMSVDLSLTFLWRASPLSLRVLSHSVMPDSVRPHGLQPSRLLCLCNFSGKNTGVGWHFFLCVSPALQGISLPAEPLGKPFTACGINKYINDCYITNCEASLAAQTVKYLPAMLETRVQCLGQEDPLKGMPAHSVFLPGEFHGQKSWTSSLVHGVA